jgi:flagellar basal-body rod modification protein FlgD
MAVSTVNTTTLPSTTKTTGTTATTAKSNTTTSGTGTTGSTKSSTATSKNTLDKDTFLKLFTTQLQYQDPLNPMDASAFTTQLAQFSSLEQLYNANDNLKSLMGSQSSLLPALSAGLIGKNVTLNDGTTGKVAGVGYDGTSTKLILDNNSSISFSDIKQISS